MDDKKLNTIVEGLCPLIKKSPYLIDKDLLEDLRLLLKEHDYYEGTSELLMCTLSHTYLDLCGFSKEYRTVDDKKYVMDRFLNLFRIFNWIRHTVEFYLDIQILREEMYEVVDRLLKKMYKEIKVCYIKNLEGNYKFVKYNSKNELKLSNSTYFKDSIEYVFKSYLNSGWKGNFRYATKEEVEQYLTNLYGINPESIPDDVIIELIFEGD